MRILHTVPDPGWAGREERVLETALWQRRHSHDAWIAAPADNDLHRLAPRDLMLDYSVSSSKGPAELRGMVKRRQIDIVDCHGEADTSSAVLAGLSAPILHTRHCLLRDRDLTPHRRVIWRELHRVIPVAAAIERELLDHAVVAPERMGVIGEWALPSFFQEPAAPVIDATRAGLGLDLHKSVVAFLGMFREEKGLTVLLRAMALARASIPDLQLLVIGAVTSTPGADLPALLELQAQARSLGLSDGVVTTGFRDDVPVLLRCVDLLVVPSLREAQSRVIPQAFASRTPVIGSAVGGIGELVDDGVTGWLVAPNDPAALAARIVDSIRMPAARSEIARRAFAFARDHLGQDARMHDTLAAYEMARKRLAQASKASTSAAAASGCDSSNPLAGLRVMLVVAHPDDETLGAGAALADCARVTLVHVTDGAPSRAMARRRGFATRSAYAAARMQELRRAIAHVPVVTDFITLGLRDQTAAVHMDTITAMLETLLPQVRPDVLLTHPFEGGHPDHDATAVAVHRARRRSDVSIPIFEFAGYHNAHGIETFGCFIPRDDAVPTRFRFTSESHTRKATMLAEFASQQAVVASFPLDCEPFRLAPAYDFTVRPHDGVLFYERHRFGMTWPRWVRLVRRTETASTLRSIVSKACRRIASTARRLTTGRAMRRA